MENITFKNITEEFLYNYISKNKNKKLLIKEEKDLEEADELNDKDLKIIYLKDIYIFHPLYIDLIKIIFECICTEHNEIFYNNNLKNINNFNILNKLLTKDSRCIKKECKQKFRKIEIINKEGDKQFTDGNKFYSAEQVRTIFCKVFNKNNNLSFNPKDLILNYIPLIPKYIRPSTSRDETVYDDILTDYYKKIIKINNGNINKNREKESIYDIYEKILYKQNNDKQKSIIKRLSSKKGIFRNNILGKRTKLCGRSVITPEIRLKIDEISIPFEISNKLKIKEDNYVLFIRHPTLQKMSVMSMKIKIHNDSYTIKMNTSLCTAYNADFDGDEMNIFYFKDYKSISEAKYINSSIKCIISPQNYNPIIYLSQDYIFGMYMLSKNNINISKNIYYNCLSIYSKFSNKFKKNINYKTFNGRSLLSFCFPNNLKYNNNEIEIRDGFLLKGCINKENILKIIKQLSFTENDFIVSEFIYNSQLIINEWLKSEGISIGYEECYSKNVEISKKKNKNNFSINKLNIINKNIIKNIINNNMIKNIIFSGSKGTIINLYHIISCIGQQYIKNKKPKKLILDNNIIGLCYNSYRTGLNPIEYYYHCQSAREGIINTNITTPIVGYLNRNLIKMMENAVIQYNNYLTYNNYIIN